jgi:hypothetical protein
VVSYPARFLFSYALVLPDRLLIDLIMSLSESERVNENEGVEDSKRELGIILQHVSAT